MNVQNDEILRRKNIVRDDRDRTSAKLSESARYIGFGLAGLTFVLFTSSSDFAKHLLSDYGGWILLVSAIGCFIIFCDFLQYLAGYIISSAAYQNVEKVDPTDPAQKLVNLYDRRLVRIRMAFFYTKVVASVCGSFGLIVILGFEIARILGKTHS